MGLFPLSKGDKTIIQIIETNADKIKTQVIVLLKLDNCCKRQANKDCNSRKQIAS